MSIGGKLDLQIININIGIFSDSHRYLSTYLESETYQTDLNVVSATYFYHMCVCVYVPGCVYTCA